MLGIAFGAVFVWGLASWFLAAGVYRALAHRPEGRRDTARCFGASGASLYLGYVRIALCSLPSWVIVAAVWLACLNAVEARLEFSR